MFIERFFIFEHSVLSNLILRNKDGFFLTMNEKDSDHELSRLVFISKSMTHYDLAKVIYHYFKNDYI